MSNKDTKENLESQQAQEQEVKPLFGGTDSFGNERIFKTTEDAQKSWQSSQDFIKSQVEETNQLKARIQELEATAQQGTKLDEALELLNKKAESNVTDNSNQQTNVSNPSLDIEALKKELTQEILGGLDAKQQETVFVKNEQESIQAAKSVFGDTFETELRNKASALGMSDNDIIQEARANPTKFKALFGLNKQSNPTFVPTTSGVPPKGKNLELNLNPCFNQADKVKANIDNFRKIAEAGGIKVNF